MKTLKLMAFMAITGLLFACEEDNINPKDQNNLIEIATITDGDIQFRILSEDILAMGYHQFIIEATDLITGKEVSGLNPQINPMMDMSMHSHSAPFENLADSNLSDGEYPFAVVFIMAGDWKLNLEYDDGSGLNGTTQFTLSIQASDPLRVKSFTEPGGDKLFVSLLTLKDPEVGQNEFGIAIHRKINMMEFPPVSNCEVAIEPSMPSMGHGSPNNVNPVHLEDGHYSGSVNFTMDGEWVIEVSILEEGTEIGQIEFDVLL